MAVDLITGVALATRGFPFLTLHRLCSAFLIALAGWTLAAQACVLSGWNIKALIACALPVIALLFAVFYWIRRMARGVARDASAASAHIDVPSSASAHALPTLLNEPSRIALAGLVTLPVALALSFPLFLCVAVALALHALCLRGDAMPASRQAGDISELAALRSRLLVCGAIAAGIILSLAIVRGDLDDAYYAAVSAFSSAHPDQPLLAGDPMFGEAGLPLVFPSYRFASFELLAGALAYLAALPAMDVYYIVLLPLWAALAVMANFLLAKALSPQRWLMLGMAALLLTLLLGEMHRAPANFSFVRLYQGKAVFVSVMVPLMFYFTARYADKRGSNKDLFLLACCQIGAIGLTNFGMLAAPLAGFGAVASNLLLFAQERKKLVGALAVLLIPLPFLIDVALQSRGSPIFAQPIETAEQVWQSVFGKHQQYLACLLLMAGPVLAKDRITRWRLAMPPLLLFAVYLNPWLSAFIAMHVTTPPVYWRVVWSFPVLMVQAASLCLIIEAFAERCALDISLRRKIVSRPGVLFALTALLIAAALPFFALRPKNIGPFDGFAGWKAGSADIAVAKQAIAADSNDGRLLAPDEIAGLASRFEQHPRLVNVRSEYVDAMAQALGQDGYRQRRVLTDFVLGRTVDEAAVHAALRALDVAVVVVRASNDAGNTARLLEAEGYRRMDEADAGVAYVIWRRNGL